MRLLLDVVDDTGEVEGAAVLHVHLLPRQDAGLGSYNITHHNTEESSNDRDFDILSNSLPKSNCS